MYVSILDRFLNILEVAALVSIIDFYRMILKRSAPHEILPMWYLLLSGMTLEFPDAASELLRHW